MKKFICASLLTVTIGFTVNSTAATMYAISYGSTSQAVNPLRSAESAISYYDFDTRFVGSGNPEFGTQAKTGFFWLYEDTTTNDISLGMIWDAPLNDSRGKVTLATSGFPSSAMISIADDPGETDSLINGIASWTYYKCCSDGALIGGLNDLWSINLDVLSSTGIDSWFFLDGPNASSPNRIALSMGEGSPLTIEATTVPEPESLILLSVGMFLLTWFTNKGNRISRS